MVGCTHDHGQHLALATKPHLDPVKVASQLPDTFWIETIIDDDHIVIGGNDFGQWTLDDYVRPNFDHWGIDLDELASP